MGAGAGAAPGAAGAAQDVLVYKPPGAHPGDVRKLRNVRTDALDALLTLTLTLTLALALALTLTLTLALALILTLTRYARMPSTPSWRGSTPSGVTASSSPR